MATIEKLKVKIVKNGKPDSSGEVEVLHWTKRDRILRATAGLLIGWTVAAFSIVVPIVHFVTVPGFFIVGIIACLALYGSTEGAKGGKGICPECKQEFRIEGGRSVPFDDVCNHCRAHFRIEGV